MAHYRPPATAALRAFVAAARLSSFTAAGRELNQTQSAVSHQIKELEALLGAELFARQARGIALTESGRIYLPYAIEALDRLRTGAQAIGQARRERVLTVSMSPNFAAKWLVPRVGAFSAAHPEIDLRISAAVEHVTFEDDGIDVAIRHGDGSWPHLHMRRLCPETLYPVCSPTVLAGAARPLALEDLANHVLLHAVDRSGWEAWLRAFGHDPGAFAVDRGPVFSQMSLAIDAAVAGQGIALARSALVALDLASARLVRPVAEARMAGFAYWIVCPKASNGQEKIRKLSTWLIAEAARDQETDAT